MVSKLTAGSEKPSLGAALSETEKPFLGAQMVSKLTAGVKPAQLQLSETGQLQDWPEV